MINYIYIYSFSIFRFFIKNTPKVILDFLLNLLTSLVYFVDKKHRKIALVNLDLAFENKISIDKKNDIIKKCYKNLVFSLADFVKNQGASKNEILSKVTFRNEHILVNALNDKKKIILMTGHYGNWELLPLSIAAKFTPMCVVGRDLDSKAMNTILSKNREQFDIELLSKKGAMKGMISALKNNRPIGLLVDQNTSDTDGILINFFGKKARHTSSLAVLAKKFNAVIIPAFISSSDNCNYTVDFFDELNTPSFDDIEYIQKSVQAQADITQKVIENKPEEWFWLHKRWKNKYEELYK